MKREQMALRLRESKKKAFLRHFLKLRSVALAAARVGITRQTAHKWLKKDAHFREAYDSAVETVLDAVELELMRLGDGTYSKPIASGGKIVGEEKIRSEKALLAVLAAYRPRYRPHETVELTGGTTHRTEIVKKEVTAVLIVEAAKFLIEAGVTFGGAALPENADGQGIGAILDDVKFRHKTAPLFLQPAPDMEKDE